MKDNGKVDYETARMAVDSFKEDTSELDILVGMLFVGLETAKKKRPKPKPKPTPYPKDELFF